MQVKRKEREDWYVPTSGPARRLLDGIYSFRLTLSQLGSSSSSEAERGAAEANRVKSRCQGCGGWWEKWYTASDLRNNASLHGPRGLPAALARTSTDSLSWDSCAELWACRSVSGRRGASFGIGFLSFDTCRLWPIHSQKVWLNTLIRCSKCFSFACY